jgi:phage shock protein C
MKNQRLYRSQTNKVFAGVCGGYAEYFDIDPVIIRILFVLLTMFGGSGMLLYIASIFIVPKRPLVVRNDPAPVQTGDHSMNGKTIFGAILITGGLFLLFENLGIFSISDFFHNSFDFAFPIVLIIAGMGIIYYHQSKKVEPKLADASTASEEIPQASISSPRQFRRSHKDKKIAGVCGGIAEYFEMDSSIIRVLYIILCVASLGAGLLLYFLLAIILPYDTITEQTTQSL